MKPTAHDFSATIRVYLGENLSQKQLADYGQTSETTISNCKTGYRQPSNKTLGNWWRCLALPALFRNACEAELKRRHAVEIPLFKAVTVAPNLDYNRDGVEDKRDLEEIQHRKADLGEKRRHRSYLALADDRVDADELAEDSRLAGEEEELSRAESLLLSRFARRQTVSQSSRMRA